MVKWRPAPLPGVLALNLHSDEISHFQRAWLFSWVICSCLYYRVKIFKGKKKNKTLNINKLKWSKQILRNTVKHEGMLKEQDLCEIIAWEWSQSTTLAEVVGINLKTKTWSWFFLIYDGSFIDNNSFWFFPYRYIFLIRKINVMSSLLLIFYITVSLQQTFIFQAVKIDHVLRWFQLSIMISILCSLRVLSFLVQVWGSEWKNSKLCK